MKQNEEDDDEEFLSDHGQGMRKALCACRRLMMVVASSESSSVSDSPSVQIQGLKPPRSLTFDLLHAEAHEYATLSKVRQRRQQALFEFVDTGVGTQNDTDDDDALEMPRQCYTRDGLSSPAGCQAFRRRFAQANRPCLVDGLTEPYFARVRRDWNSPQTFRKWMQQNMLYRQRRRQQQQEHADCRDGNDGDANELLLLPVRRLVIGHDHNHAATDDDDLQVQGNAHNNPTPTLLDEDGRASECATVKMTLSDWIAYLDDEKNNNHDTRIGSSAEKDYLKDWHLEAWLEQHGSTPQTGKSSKSSASATASLYQLPAIFAGDLLNPFLRAFTGGDYRFVYWGPAGSRTAWHSDVLHSFSWSYNVYGRKEWIFLVPKAALRTDTTTSTVAAHHDDIDGPQHRNNDNDHARRPKQRIVKIVQNAGECIFVPATWKHQVVNLEETLSINRNWITAANLDLCWDCLVMEIGAIEHELAAWSADYDWEARESMLRGCVGLDVTAFYLMILYRLSAIIGNQNDNVVTPSDENTTSVIRDPDADASFEVMRCIGTLQTLLHGDNVHLAERLAATMASANLAQEAIQLGENVFRLATTLGTG